MILKNLKKIGTISIISSILLLIISFSSAVGILASPGGFQVNMGAPQIYYGVVDVENIGDDTVNFVIENKKLLTDNIHLEFSDNGIAQWISVHPNNFTLTPHSKKQVSFTVNIPSNVNYSDALGALVINGYPVKNQQNIINNSFQVQQVPQIIVPIAVGFAGPIVESLSLIEKKIPSFLVTFMPGKFIYHAQNNGTVYANMTGNIKLNGWFNTDKINISGGVYPDDKYYLIGIWTPGLLDFGLYHTETTINYGRYNQSQTIISQDNIFVFPIWLIILYYPGLLFIF
ncbi:MAG: hypothetical protein PHY59_08010 [Methanobacterium sp.]|nr:hypothetical protein [Methanobacterium sp.]